MSFFKSRFIIVFTLSLFVSVFTISAAHAQYIVCKGQKFLSFENNQLVTDQEQTVRVGMFDASDSVTGMNGSMAVDLIDQKGERTVLDIGVAEYRLVRQSTVDVYDHDQLKQRWRKISWPVGVYELVPQSNDYVATASVQVPYILEDSPLQSPTAMMTVNFKSGGEGQYTSWCRIR